MLTINLFNGLVYGAVLIVMCSGLALIYGLRRVVNFAHGALYMLGAYIGFTVAMHSNFWVALLAAPLAMAMVGVLAGTVVLVRGGPALPDAPAGWWGLGLLTLLYGTGITLLFTVLPRLGVVGNSAIMNVEPVFALILAWLILGQAVAPVQLLGALIVVGAVIWLGTRKK